jgi:hypothetical protein
MAIVLNVHDKLVASCVFADDQGDAIDLPLVWQRASLALVIVPAPDGQTAEIEAMMPGWTEVTIKGDVPDGVPIQGDTTAGTYTTALDIVVKDTDAPLSHSVQAVFTVRDGVEMTRQVRPA